MKVLHIVREIDDQRAREAVRQHLHLGHKVTLLLLHDAVLGKVDSAGCAVFACRDDAEARGVGGRWPAVDYGAIVDMVFEADRVVSW